MTAPLLRIARLIPLALLAAGPAACRLVDCTPQDQSRPISASESVAGAPGSVRGVVVAIASGLPVAAAQVRVVPGDTTWRGVSAEGRFDFPNVVGGAALLEVRAPRFTNASVALRPRSDSALAVLAALATSPPVQAGGSCGQAPGTPDEEQ